MLININMRIRKSYEHEEAEDGKFKPDREDTR